MVEDRPTILFECTRRGLADFGRTAGEVYRHLADRGYGIWLIRDRLEGGPPLDLGSFTASMSYPFRAFNFVAAAD
jgi:hypothetical protein